MTLTIEQKEQIKSQLLETLSTQKEVQKIIIFGSFLSSPEPHDIDVAVFQDSTEKYIPLAMKYRNLVRELYQYIPVDVIPIKINASGNFLNEIQAGETIYER